MKSIEQVKEAKTIAEEKIQGILLELITETGIEILDITEAEIISVTANREFCYDLTKPAFKPVAAISVQVEVNGYSKTVVLKDEAVNRVLDYLHSEVLIHLNNINKHT